MRIYRKEEMIHYNKDDIKTFCGKKDAANKSDVRKDVTCSKCLVYSSRF
jgi:hypothetical protein